MWRLLRWRLSLAQCNSLHITLRCVGLCEWWGPNLEDSSAWLLFPTCARSLIAEIFSGNSVNSRSNNDDRFPNRKCVGWVIDGWRNSSSAELRRFLSKQSDLEHRSLVHYAHCLEITAVNNQWDISLRCHLWSSITLQWSPVGHLEEAYQRSFGVARYHAQLWMPEMRQNTGGRHTRWLVVAPGHLL